MGAVEKSPTRLGNCPEVASATLPSRVLRVNHRDIGRWSPGMSDFDSLEDHIDPELGRCDA